MSAGYDGLVAARDRTSGRLFRIVQYMSFLLLTQLTLTYARTNTHTHTHACFCHAAQIDCTDGSVGKLMLRSAVKRAKQFLSSTPLSFPNEQQGFSTKPVKMVGQVGGLSSNHKPMMVWAPHFVLKPLQSKNRGLREVAFYEAMKLASSQTGLSAYDALVLANAGKLPNAATGTPVSSQPGRSSKDAPPNRGVIENCDLVAMWVALILKDPVVVASESRLSASGQLMKREMELLRRLSNFTANYYGVVDSDGGDSDGNTTSGTVPSNEKKAKPSQELKPSLSQPQRQPQLQSQSQSQHYVLLQDIRANFVKPCMMDIKMGTQTYEPDAPTDKRRRERSKYQQQSIFGMRIVGMRRYDPTDPHSDQDGFVTVDKNHGRSLATRGDLVDAFRWFFSSTTAGGSKVVRTQSISNILMLLQLLRRWFDENNCLCFYSSSILLVYEGATDAGGSSTNLTNMKMVDFGHVRREAGGDHGYILGLRTISSILKELIGTETKKAHP